MGEFILAIDQGTTGSTVLLFDERGQVAGRGYREITQHYPRPGWVEHDALEIWQKTLEALGDCLESAGKSSKDIHAIGITNQRETVVLWERATGNPVGRAIVWQDRRTADDCLKFAENGLEALVRERSGLLLDAYFSASKVRWLLQADPALARRASGGELAMGTMDTWLLWKLTGGRVHATDVTNASRTMIFDIHKLAWDKDLLDAFGIPEALLPQVAPSAGAFGSTAAVGPLEAGIPISAVLGDQHAALFGQGCFEAGQAKNTYGTGCFMLLNTGKAPVMSQNRLLTTLAWQIEGQPPLYALEGSVFIAGACIQWLRDGLKLLDSAAESEALARSVEDNGGVYLVPAFAGLGAPYWDGFARGAMLGLTGGSTRAHVVRAALEAIAYQTQDVLAAMVKDSRTNLKTLRVDGGASANDFLMQFQADLLGIPLLRRANVESTAWGAAALAGLQTGFYADQATLTALADDASRFTPAMAPETRRALYANWQKAVERSRGWITPSS